MMRKASEYEETGKATGKPQEDACNPEVLGDPMQCIEAWGNRMSEELRRIRPILEPLTRAQYPNPFIKWVEAFRIEAENFNRKAGENRQKNDLKEFLGERMEVDIIRARGQEGGPDG
jgi:hypothetical protein